MKYSIISIALLSMFSILEMSCNSSKEIQISESEEPIIVLSKERCRGFCPAFTISFFEPNKVQYNGVANMDILGEKLFTIPKSDFTKLKESFKKNNFKKMENEYIRERIMDIPKVTLMYDGHSIIYHKSKAPESVIALSNLVEEFIPK